MKGNRKKSKVRKSISLKKETFEKGMELARKRNRNFSNLIETLIACDSAEAVGAK